MCKPHGHACNRTSNLKEDIARSPGGCRPEHPCSEKPEFGALHGCRSEIRVTNKVHPRKCPVSHLLHEAARKQNSTRR